MDNPFIGLVDGQFIATSMRRFPSSCPSVFPWVEQCWAWYGQDSGFPIAGSCGAPIWDKDGRVISFFRFMEDSGMEVSVAALVLEYHGYSIV
jgi:hypothetical protein